MKALIFEGKGQIQLKEIEKPSISYSTDAIVKLLKTTICGTDLHIIKGDVPTCENGRILGHEGIGVIAEIGEAVTDFKIGDHVLISCITSDGKCEFCRKGMYSHCINGGWVLGNKIDGTQAEYVLIPYADTSLYKLPENLQDDCFVLLSDILPTGFECGVLNGKIKPGKSVAIVGAGPIGIAALLTAQLYSPAQIILIDTNAHRLNIAKKLGASTIINSTEKDPVAEIMRLTGNQGVDTAIEAVGIPATFVLCQDIVAAGGTIANIGVHGSKADLHLERLWFQNITITTRLVDTVTTPLLLKLVMSKKLDPDLIISHRFKFNDILEAYETFSHATEAKAIKVIIEME